jgi:phospholipase/carboxylesterase
LIEDSFRMTVSPESLVVLLHGVGANGANLAPLGEALQEFLPGAAVAAPDAPHPFDRGGDGRQWFSVIGVTDANRARRVIEARADFDRVVAREIERAGFAGRLDRVALFGFSQGAILSLDALVDGRWPVAAVVAASGRLATQLGPTPAVATPVLILHGEQDEVISATEAGRAKRILEGAGFAVEAHVYTGLGHRVSVEGLEAAAAFLAERLSPKAA